MEASQSEDCLIFYGLTPKVTKMRPVYDSLSIFMRSKQTKDPSDRFNLIVFLKDGPNYLDHFTFSPYLILKMLKSLDRKIVPANIAGGLFVAVTFIIEVFKKISQKIFRLLIIIDHETRKIQLKYFQVLVDLIEAVKDMPFFIDVICIDKKDSQENWYLEKLAELTKGSFVKIPKVKNLDSILTTFSEKKYIPQKNSVILKKNQPFYINLADDPLDIDEISQCSICFQRDDRGIVKCPSCETVVHKTCWSQWAKISNIGISNVFRCHNCFNILKLNENFIIDVQSGIIPIEAQVKEFRKKNIVTYLKDLEAKSVPKIIQVVDPMTSVPKIIVQEDYTQKKEKKSRISVILCPNCSEMTTSLKSKCPTCGFNLL